MFEIDSEINVTKLCRAMLDEALSDLLAGTGWTGASGRRGSEEAKPADRESAARWMAETDSENPLSFENCCAAIGADPVKVRAWVRGKCLPTSKIAA